MVTDEPIGMSHKPIGRPPSNLAFLWISPKPFGVSGGFLDRQSVTSIDPLASLPMVFKAIWSLLGSAGHAFGAIDHV